MRAADDTIIMTHAAFGIKIHNNGLPGEGEILSFSLDVSRIIRNCPFYIVLMGTLEVNIFS